MAIPEASKVTTQVRWINRDLLQLKVSLFLIFGATCALVPYLTIHMQSIGLTVHEVAAVYLTLLFTTCLSPPLTGYLIDRFGRYKPVLLVSLVLNAVSHHAINLIPARTGMMIERNFTLKLHNDALVVRDGPVDFTCPSGGVLLQSCLQEQITVLPLELHSGEELIECGNYSISVCTLNSLQAQDLPLNDTLLVKTEYDGTFWTYLLVRFVATSMLSSSLTITDPMALAMIEKYGGDFGREKLFSSIGMAIFTPLTGLMIDGFSQYSSETVYTPAFYTYDILLMLSLVSISLMPIGEKLPSENVMNDMMKILRLPQVMVFLIFLFLLGNYWGFIESYLFVIMKDMGSPNYLLGLTYTVGTVASIPMMYCMQFFTKHVGHVNLLVTAFFAHALRILGYSWIANPYWCFPIELNEAISCYFMWVIATTYCAVLAPSDLVATLIGIAGMVHFCLGKGIGSFVGGYLIAQLGLRMTFRYVGYSAIACGVAYKAVHLLWLKKYERPQAHQQRRRPSQVAVPKVDQFGSLVSLHSASKARRHPEAVPLGRQ